MPGSRVIARPLVSGLPTGVFLFDKSNVERRKSTVGFEGRSPVCGRPRDRRVV